MEHFEYRRSTRVEAWRAVALSILFNALFVCCFLLPVFSFHPRPNAEEGYIWLVGFLLAVLVCCNIAAFFYIWRNFSCDRDFVCRIDGCRVSQICPVRRCGETFTINIADIEKIEWKSYDGSPDECFLWDKSQDRRYRLTRSYLNPIREIVRIIKEMNSEIVEVETPDRSSYH